MHDFFKPWRRNVGVVTLVVACVFMACWFKSIGEFNHVTFQSGREVIEGFASTGGELWWGRTHGRGYGNVVKDPFCHLYSAWRLYEFRWQVLGFEFYKVRDKPEELDTTTTMMVLPYWSIAFPLTLLSAYLLLSHPRPAKPPAQQPT